VPFRYRYAARSWSHLLLAAVAFILCAAQADAAASEGSQEVAARKTALKLCRLPDLRRPARCGVFEIPENPSRPHARRLPISVAVVPAASGKALADPIVTLMGGPGEDAISGAAYYAAQFGPLLQERDLLLVDQRGTGRSATLQCNLYAPEEAAQNLQDFFPLAAVRRCAQQSRTRADLSQYTYAHLASDLEHIRRALGYGQLNLFSASYGTRAAQVYLRTYPQNVRTVYFGSVVPIDVTIPVPLAKAAELAMEKTFAACAADAGCHAEFPNLPTEFREMLARLDSGVNVSGPGITGAVRLTHGRVAEILRAKLYRVAGAATVPWLVHQAYKGNWTPIVDEILSSAQERDSSISFGLFFTITCNEDVAFIRESDVRTQTQGMFVGDYRVRQQQAACKEWPKSSLPPGYREPVRSPVPALFSSGDSDPASPLWFTARVAGNFPNRREVHMRNQGHTEWSDCLGRLYERLVRSGTVRGLEPSCDTAARPPFKTRQGPGPETD
jgi:pimeloyl-ACP methyl ester carboxylesterase